MKETDQAEKQKGSSALPKFLRGLFGGRSRSTAPAVEETAVAPAAANGSHGPKVLIVDDDPVILKTVGTKLSKAGFEVLTRTDGAEAIGTVRTEHPDAIVLDLCLPADVNVSWDGFAVMEWLRRLENGDTPPIVIITGLDSGKLRDRALAAGAVAFFQKPIDNDSLIEVIQKSLADRKAAQGEKADASCAVF